MHTQLYDGLNLPSLSTTSLKKQLPNAVFELTEGRLDLKNFILTFVHTELLKGQTLEMVEHDFSMRIKLSNQAVNEAERLEKLEGDELAKYRQVFLDARIKHWEERKVELEHRLLVIEEKLEEAKKLEPPTSDYDPFFLHVVNQLRFAKFIVEEHIASDPKPIETEDLDKWKKDRLEMIRESIFEHDRVAKSDSERIKDISEWVGMLRESLNEQIDDKELVINEP